MAEVGDILEVESFLRRHKAVAEPTLLYAGQDIGEWIVTAYLGCGGSGEVYRVKHRFLDTAAAVKILVRDDAATRDRFKREADILLKNLHPAFPRFFGFGEVDGRPYMVIEILEHLPLPKKDREVARYMLKLCEGVRVLHGLGLIHRDIKPQNVLQRGEVGDPVLIDLGLVKDVKLAPAHSGVSLSIVNGKAMGVGTPKYSAPEQFAGGNISPAADVHALGMLANECFEGKPPRCWERIIRRSTSSIPSQRYANVEELMTAIRRRHTGVLIRAAGAFASILAVACIFMLGVRYRASERQKEVLIDKVNKLTVDAEKIAEGVRRESEAAKLAEEAEDRDNPKSGAFAGDGGIDQDI